VCVCVCVCLCVCVCVCVCVCAHVLKNVATGKSHSKVHSRQAQHVFMCVRVYVCVRITLSTAFYEPLGSCNTNKAYA